MSLSSPCSQLHCWSYFLVQPLSLLVTRGEWHWLTENWVRQWAGTEHWVIWRARLQAPAPTPAAGIWWEESGSARPGQPGAAADTATAPAWPGPISQSNQTWLISGQYHIHNHKIWRKFGNFATFRLQLRSRVSIIFSVMKFILVENMIISDRVESQICRRALASFTKKISTIPENISHLRQDTF